MPVTTDSTSVTITLPDSPQTSVKILNFGATAISWKVKGAEKLFLSESAKLDGSKAVRGGIPLVFPRFGPASGNHPATDKLPQHGFARNTTWEFLGEVDPATVQFGLGPEQLDAKTREQWGYDFTLIATFSLVSANELSVKLDVENTDKKPFDFNVLFHTYFRVPEVEDVSVDGLTNLKFYNKVADKNEESGTQPLTVHEEIDRVYKSSPTTAAINAAGKPQFTVTNSKELTDTVVWNPWTSVENLSDFSPKTGFHNMICVEKGNVNGFTTVQPGDKWTGSMVLKSHI